MWSTFPKGGSKSGAPAIMRNFYGESKSGVPFIKWIQKVEHFLEKGDESDAPVDRKYLKVGAVGKYFYSNAPTYR